MKFNPLTLLPATALILPIAAPLPAETPPPAPANGQAIFQQRCQSCHSAEPGRNSPLGPNLAGIVGRKAAAGEFRYSPALSAANLTWTPEQLDAYLAAPTRLVPGTRMAVGLPDPVQRAAVIDYLTHAGH